MAGFSRLLQETLGATSAQLVASAYMELTRFEKRRITRNGGRLDCPTRKRDRVTMGKIYRNMGEAMFRRAFRMSYFNFKVLYNTIKQSILRVMNDPKPKSNAPNGRIPLSSRLGIAIRFFAGGSLRHPCSFWCLVHRSF